MHKLLPILVALCCATLATGQNTPLLLHDQIAQHYFQEDRAWYLQNIPFFDCSDEEIEEVYYYRWKLYKAHIRKVGDEAGHVITEFITHVPWDREPWCTINAASMHHIMEGRWLRDGRYMDDYIKYLYQHGGNNRRYSESVADASFQRFLVDGDRAFIASQLDSMKVVYDGWADHWDAAKNMYYIPAMPDATEYTIASIDGSGGTAGFDGGEAFRPTINSYQWANARAISRIAAMKGDKATSQDFARKAAELKRRVQQNLWNEQHHHFLDRYQMDNQYVHYWDFIRGRELAGFAPWYFGLPDDDPKYHAAWQHLTDTTRLLGPHGFRTNEPGYEHYFKQFIYPDGKRGSQWNGPSWPYQTSQALSGMANFLHDYRQKTLSTSDYLHALRLYTRQHYLPDGRINLVENYDPNLGGPLVYYQWSNHYLHSSYNNLVISGLCGVQPSESDTLTLHPLMDNSIEYFCLENLKYHGHDLTIAYDADGNRYKLGKGLTVFLDGKKVKTWQEGGKTKLLVGKAINPPIAEQPTNHALNIARSEYPRLTASINADTDSLNYAVDGRTWYFTEVQNHWNTKGSKAETDWLAIDFGAPKEVSSVRLYPVVDVWHYELPTSLVVEFWENGQWKPTKIQPHHWVRNTENVFDFSPIQTSKIRMTIGHKNGQVALTEVEIY